MIKETQDSNLYLVLRIFFWQDWFPSLDIRTFLELSLGKKPCIFIGRLEDWLSSVENFSSQNWRLISANRLCVWVCVCVFIEINNLIFIHVGDFAFSSVYIRACIDQCFPPSSARDCSFLLSVTLFPLFF